jgi:hypothetical protein
MQTVRPVEVDDQDIVAADLTSYEIQNAKYPQKIRDHMPDLYLQPLLRVNGFCIKTATEEAPVLVQMEPATELKLRTTQKMLDRVTSRKATAGRSGPSHGHCDKSQHLLAPAMGRTV